jgi:hypothetical protein
MIRALFLVSVLALAGCVTTGESRPPPPQIAGIGEVRISAPELPGAPQSVADLFDDEFDWETLTRHIPYGSAGNTMDLVGYLSVVSSNSGTLVIYVFDFRDMSGNRLLRVGGQTTSAASPENPWDVVDRQMVQYIVDRVFQDFDQWLADNAVGV